MVWKTQRFGDVCKFVRGPFGGSLKKNIFKEEGYAVYEQKHAIYDQFAEIRYFVEKEKFNEMIRFELFSGDLIMSCSGTMGKIAIVPPNIPRGIINQALLKLTPNKILSSEFLKLWMESRDFQEQIEFLSQGAAIKNMASVKILKEIKVPTPSETEQKRIVALLDTVFSDLEKTRAKTEQNLKNSRELFDSYLQQVFSQKGEGWAEKTLKEASLDFGRGKSKHRPRNDVSLYGGEYPFVQTGDVRNCEHLITKYSKTYNEVGLAQSKLWPKGTICITIAANIAETGILDFDSCFPDSVIGVVVNPEVTTIPYVEFLLQSFKAILQAKSKGSAQANINMGTFEKLHFPFPNINKQNEIVDSLNELMLSVQQLEVIYQKKLNSIDELKKSILQKAFSGELTASAE
jgi:type I restriction enzyme S subunit